MLHTLVSDAKDSPNFFISQPMFPQIQNFLRNKKSTEPWPDFYIVLIPPNALSRAAKRRQGKSKKN